MSIALPDLNIYPGSSQDPVPEELDPSPVRRLLEYNETPSNSGTSRLKRKENEPYENTETAHKRTRATVFGVPCTSYLSRAPDSPHVHITSFMGRRTYIPLEEFRSEPAPSLAHGRDARMAPSFQFLYDSILREMPPEVDQISPEVARAAATTSSLWVQKYTPQRFTELISDEKLNRLVLEWVKSWDECVFGSTTFKTRMRAALQLQQAVAAKQSAGGQRGNKAFSPTKKSPLRAAKAPAPKGKAPAAPAVNDARPEKRILLLHGPPGAGKTTLAHIIARQAGYRVVEVNASDDRSAAAFYARVLPALENESVDQGQPNCVVVDEIDGAAGAEGQGAVDCLLSIINYAPKRGASAASGADQDEGGGLDPVTGKKKRKKKKSDGPSRPLSRPIICICNDLYAPALAKLRDVAYVLKADKPDTQRLIQRLHQVAEAEGLRSDTKGLLALAELADNDIRSCLNTLQFIRKKSTLLRAEMLTDAVVGEKDQEKNIFRIWEDIFRLPHLKNDVLSEARNQRRKEEREQRELMLGEVEDEDDDEGSAFLRRYYSGLYNAMQSHTERDRVVDGAWHNMFATRTHDPLLDKSVLAIDWFGFADIITRTVRADQSHGLESYVPAALVAEALLLAGEQQPQVTYPKEEADAVSQLYRSRAILSQVKARAGLGTAECVELLSPLLDIINPPIRTVNMSILSPAEKQAVQNVVEVMGHLHLSYVQRDNEEDGSPWQLDPPVDRLVRFKGLPYDHHSLSAPQKEFVSKRLELYHLQQEELARTPAKAGPGSPKKPLSPLKAAEEAKAKRDLKNKLLANSQKLAAAPVDAPKDFFGRPIKPKASAAKPAQPQPGVAVAEATETKPAKPRPPVAYKYKEGYTNAVRRKTYMRDFI